MPGTIPAGWQPLPAASGLITVTATALFSKTMLLNLIDKNVVVFCYHVISDSPLSHISSYGYKTCRDFENDLIFLKRNFQLINYGDLKGLLASGRKLPRKGALITFDDGLSQCFSQARPLLLKHNVPCVFFVTTDFIDNKVLFYDNKISLCLHALDSCGQDRTQKVIRDVNGMSGASLKNTPELVRWLKKLGHDQDELISRVCVLLGVDVDRFLKDEKPYLSSEEIRILAGDGFTIGSHGQSHVRLDLLDQGQAEKEIASSSKAVMGLLGVSSLPFAFPFHGIFMDRSFLKSLLSKYPFIDLFFDTQGLFPDDGSAINRVWVDSPFCAKKGRSNIPILILLAYKDYLKRRIGSFIKKKRG